ncbi:MAG: integrase arm-type DNA-binding domain-containing protein [Aquabacterium sp.]|uniref:tyrosine-type recombinase/integrase n=1 Tax=Aquabacterium sp. TaxID=1872578 RepID=UPI0025B8E7C7|nr:site-specific integrase [Aquabacterium sp.]MBI5925869.1 integrase arm-type DNA-binding domain-containing protein [Aquabacterium sp.]
MARKAKELSALVVGRLTAPGHHAVGGVAGLYLYVNHAGARSWVLRTMVGDKRRHMGLGGYPDVTLAQAKEKARKARDEIEQGVDPIAERHAAKAKLRAKQATDKTFKQAAELYLEAHGDSWKNPKHRAQWASTLETYAYPFMGEIPVQDIGLEHVLASLEPIWKIKTETASRLRGRIESVLNWATVRKFRTGENPARWKGHLDHLLATPGKVKKVEHRRALPLDEMQSFMLALSQREGNAARALEFAILTAARSGEVRGATWSEVDLKDQVWTIPGERMKAGKEHRVPLSTWAVKILRAQSTRTENNLIFPAPRGGQLSDMTLTAVMRRMEVDAVPHGFRSTFRDWAGERTNFPRELAEQALAHTLKDKVEAAYRRGDALEKRRQMMSEWADFMGEKKSLTMSEIMQSATLPNHRSHTQKPDAVE